SGGYGLGYLDAYNANLDKGNSDNDVRNRFVVSGTWNIPWGSNMSEGWERQTFGGWSFSPIIVVRSGYPYSVYDCTNLGTLGYTCPRWIPNQPVNQHGGIGNSSLAAVSPNLFNWLALPIDASTGIPVNAGDALAVPTCQYLDHGNCVYSISGLPQGPRNAYSGPSYWNFNFVIAKTFKLTERFNLQFRSEFYNAFNHSNYYIQTGNLDVEDGTGVTSIQASKGLPPAGGATERRNVQFGLKLNF
ncbi:MAG TPA: TonB-dependent receptor, partial [Candidatus Eisenbacteria bacterium]|nr:TonB-dependent receptor [Candidatus Eisenbacteria bacterium]